MRKIILIIIGIVMVLLVPATAIADPTPFASAIGTCGQDSYGEWYYAAQFPVITGDHPNAVIRVTSNGASGSGLYEDGVHFTPGDQVWESVSSGDRPAAGTQPRFDLAPDSPECSGTVQADLADRPGTPATLSGVSSGAATGSEVPIVVAHTGQYVVDATIDQGAIRILDDSFYSFDCHRDSLNCLTIARSGRYPLGALTAGDADLLVQGQGGPPVHWSLTIRALPVQIGSLAFASQWVTPGTADKASFSVSGDTTLTGYVRNATGQVIDHIGTWNVAQASSSVTWDARADDGSKPPDGLYFLHLDTSDATSAEAPIHIDSTPPVVTMVSPGMIRASQAPSFIVTDAGVGTHSLDVSVDGNHRNVSVSAGRFSVSPNASWTSRRHSWSVTATDRLGNTGTYTGSFGILAPPVRMPAVFGGLEVRPYRVAIYRWFFAGFTGHRHVRNVLKMGHVHWTSWSPGEAWATGAVWQLVCRPSCSQGYYNPVRGKIHVYRPNSQSVFTRLTLYWSHRQTTYTAHQSNGDWWWY
jgi:hypothetical protein